MYGTVWLQNVANMVLYGCKMLRNTYYTTHRIIHISGQTFGCNMLRIYRNQSLGATPESHHLSLEAGWICAAPKTQTCYVRSPPPKKQKNCVSDDACAAYPQRL